MARATVEYSWLQWYIRENDGEWIDGFAKFIRDCSAFVAELLESVGGFELCVRMGFREMQILLVWSRL